MYCRMLPLEHSAILSTFIKLPFVLKIFVLSIFEWPLKTGFTVCPSLTGNPGRRGIQFSQLQGICDRARCGKGVSCMHSWESQELKCLPHSGEFCHLLITFANSLDPDQEPQNVGPGLNPSRFDTWTNFLKKVNFKKVSARNYPACKVFCW